MKLLNQSAFLTKIPLHQHKYAGTTQKTYEVEKSVAFSSLTEKEPVPTRGWKNVRNSFLLLAALLGAGANLAAVSSFHPWAQSRTVQSKVTPGTGLIDKAQDKIARLDVESRKSLPLACVEDVCNFILMLQCLSLASFMRKRLLNKTLAPADIWKDFHQRGITGKGIRVGMIDVGLKPTSELMGHEVEYVSYGGAGTEKEISKQDPHGSAVAHIIAEACPESSFLVVYPPYADMDQQINANIQKFLDECEVASEHLTLSNLLKNFVPMISMFSQCVETSVEKGVDVINLSLGIDQRLWEIPNTYLLARMKNAFYQKALKAETQNPKIELYSALLEKMEKIMDPQHLTPEDMDEIKPLLAPWQAALDKAYAKGIPVILGAGNSGFLSNQQKKNPFGGMNLLGVMPHPALVVVGSTDHQGEVSSFSSEWKEDNHPWIAGNGSGELSTKIPTPSRSFLSKLFSPFGGLKKTLGSEQPQGTSFAVPDISALYVMMKSIYPKLTIDEAKDILATTAEPAYFSIAQKPGVLRDLQKELSQFAKPNQLTQALFLTMMDKELQAYSKTDNPISVTFDEDENGRFILYLEGDYPVDELALMTKTFQDQMDEIAKLPLGNLDIDPQLLKEATQKKLKCIVGHGRVNRYAAMAEAEKRSQMKVS